MTDDNYLKREFEQRLQSDPALFEFLQAGSLDGIWYWDIEYPENEWMSPRFWELLGYDPATKKHLSSEWQGIIDPDDLQLALDNFRKHCADPGHPFDQIVRYQHRDGSTIWVRCRGIAIRDQRGKAIRMLGAHNDLTQVMQLKEDVDQVVKFLQAREHELLTILANSPDTIARYSRNCRRTYVNPAFSSLSEGGEAALLGRKPSEQPGGANSIIYEQKINEVFSTGKNVQFELKWTGKEGKEICSHIRLTPEYDTSGNIISVLGVGRDISELNEYRAELQRKELAKSRFLAAAGHDLRQPLAAANLFISALKFTKPTSEQDEILHRLGQTMNMFNELLESLLNISKLDSGVIKPEFTPICVSEIFIWLEQSFSAFAGEKQIGLKLHFSIPDNLVIYSDLQLLKSVLQNLVSNAIKFTSRGAVLIGARRRGSEVLFQIWDTGVGISDEYLNQIFDEFYQVGNPQRDRVGGLGLGLSIAKRSMSLLGERITCRSRLGRGSVFEFRLPVYGFSNRMQRQVAGPETREEVALKEFACGKSFVIVEDDAMVAEAMCTVLSGIGGNAKHFYMTEAALNYANSEHTDYYIVDYMLGGEINGIQFLNQLKQKTAMPITAVLITGDTSPAFVRESAGYDWPVLHKPVNISQVIASLKTQAC
jgi:PAS domain S-box-containing protein